MFTFLLNLNSTAQIKDQNMYSHYVKYVTLMDRMIPAAAALITKAVQIIFEAERFLPLSKMYLMPCRVPVMLYSNTVRITAS